MKGLFCLIFTVVPSLLEVWMVMVEVPGSFKKFSNSSKNVYSEYSSRVRDGIYKKLLAFLFGLFWSKESSLEVSYAVVDCKENL